MSRLAVVSILTAFLCLQPAYGQTINLNKVFKSFGNAIEQSTNGKKSSSKNQSSKETFNRAERRQIQHDLNEIGYDVGVADGIFGSRTREAVSAFQAQIGAPTTGDLTTAQRAKLADAASDARAQLAVDTGPADFEIFENVDLPENDYRHTGIDKALENLSVAGCQSACQADGQCQAFTYNQAANWCFLKDAVSARKSFSGATSGIRIAPKDIVQASKDMPADSDDGFRAADYLIANKGPDFDLELEISLRAVHAMPALIADDKTVARWFKEEFNSVQYGKGRALATPLTEKFYNGSSFDQADAIKAFRAQLLERATGEPLKMAFGAPVSLAFRQFDPEKGIPILTSSRGKTGAASVGSHRIRFDYLHEGSVAYFDEAPNVRYLPILDEGRAREIADLLNRNRYNNVILRSYITYNRIGFQRASDGFDLAAEGTLDRVDIYIDTRKNSEITEPALLYTWDNFADQGDRAAIDPAHEEKLKAFADWAGIPMTGGRYAIYRGIHMNDTYGFYKREKSILYSWWKLKLFAYLADNPSILDNDNTVIAYADFTLSAADKNLLSEGRELFNDAQRPNYSKGLLQYDEFKRREIMRDIRQNYIDKIVAPRPVFPIPVVEVLQARLGAYDFEKARFEIEYYNSGNSLIDDTVPTIAKVLANKDDQIAPVPEMTSDLAALPRYLEMGEQEAADLIETLRKRFTYGEYSQYTDFQARYIYLAVFLDLEKGESAAGAYHFAQKELALYSEPTLENLITQLDITPYLKPAVAAREAAAKAAAAKARADEAAAIARAEEIKRQSELAARTVHFEDRNLDILGMRPGMSIAAAQRALQDTMAPNPVEIIEKGSSNSGSSLSPCGVERSRYNRDILLPLRDLDDTARAEGRDVLNADEQNIADDIRANALAEMRPECAAEFFGGLNLAFTASISYDSGLSERLAVYEAVHPDHAGRVVAIVRNFDGNIEKIDLVGNLADKYGSDYFQITKSDAYWFASADVHNRVREDEAFQKQCVARTPWPTSGISFEPLYFRTACGQYVGLNAGAMFLVDTDALAASRQTANEYLTERKAKAEEAQPLKF